MTVGLPIARRGLAADPPSPAALLLRWRLALVGALVVLAGLAWWSTGVRMAGLFALGAMSVPWMIVIAVLIAVEKLLPWRVAASAGVAATLAALAIGIAAAPASVPGLTVPTHTHAMDMQMRGMDAGQAR